MHIQFLENPMQGRYGAMEGRNQAGKQFDRLYRWQDGTLEPMRGLLETFVPVP